MSNYYFSAKNNSFYLAELKPDYISNKTWPDDLIEISDDIFNEYSSLPPEGKVRGSKNGAPAWCDIPPPAHDDLDLAAKQTKSALLSTAAAAIAPLQDAVDLDEATADEQSQLMAWKKYRVLLNRVDTSTAPDIEWPTPPAE